jgi:alpha-glucoside transport system permease protein
MIMRQGRWTPWFYLAPALLILTIFVLYPAIRTALFSFQNANSTALATTTCKAGEPCWGLLENFRQALSSQQGQIALRNTALWLLIIVPGTAVLGLLFAVLTDRVRYEPLAKAIIFMPMAISFVGAAIIWRFVYNPDPQIGILNAIVTAFGGEPRAWLASEPPSNTFLLTVIGLWMWTGFTMTLLSAALKAIPVEIIEAAHVDGANAWQTFYKIMLPLLALYLLSGLAAAAVHIAFNPASPLPTVGASGAISGVLAAYMIFFPSSRVITLVPLFFLPWFVEVPAVLYLGFWFVSQLFNGLLTVVQGVQAMGGVAWWAHVGGFVAGLVLGPIFARRRYIRRIYPDEYFPW